MDSAPDIDRAGLVGVGGEERRGIKDRWGNAWGLESHVLSPLRLACLFISLLMAYPLIIMILSFLVNIPSNP
jgi:hypothetical protein